jgi:putative Holliday junction resolvase
VIADSKLGTIMRWIGVDYGDSYLGVAVSNATNTMSVPIAVIPTAECLGYFQSMLQEDEFQGFVIGLPILLSGREGELAERSRSFGNHLIKNFNLKILYEDERFTTKQSELLPKKKGKRTDDIAASIILQQYLDRKKE